MKPNPIIQQWGSKSHQSAPGGSLPRWLELLHQRGLSAETAAHFGIRPQGHGWVYPVALDYPVRRWKAFPGQRGAKYLWKPAQPDDITFYDPHSNLVEHIAAAGGVLILATGEADVWALHEGGIFNATATMRGEGVIPSWLVDELHRLAVVQVLLFPDCDTAGLRFAAQVQKVLTGTGIALALRALPYPAESKGDIGRLLIDVGPENLYKTLTNCPPLVLPVQPEPVPAHRPYTPSASSGDSSALEEIERRVRAEIARALVKRGKKEGYYQCPLEHGSEGKDFLFNPEPGQPIGGCQGKHAGLLTRWVDLAEHLQIDVSQIARDVAEERRPARTNLTAATETYTSRFPYGAPFTLLRRMHNLSHLVAVQKQHPAAYVLILWHEIRHLIPDDAWLAWGDLQQAARQIGRNPSRDTVITGLDQLTGLLGVQCLEVQKIIPIRPGEGSVHFCDLEVQNAETLQVAKVATWRRKTSNVRLYRFVPTAEALDCFARRYYTALREQAFAQAPDQTQPEWGDLIPDDVAEWEEHRSPLYAQYAAQRERAIEQLERSLGYLEQDLERIEAGRNKVVTLPPGEIRNSADYRAAFHLARVIDLGGERENAYKARFELGISRSALARTRDRAGLITIERTKVVAAAELTQYQRDYLVKEWHNDGTVTVKLPCAEKLRAKASSEELASYEEKRAVQRERAARRKLPDLLPAPVETPASAPAPKPPVLPLVMWQGYSEAYLQRQYDYAPLPADFAPYDPDTGELYPPGQLWKRGAEYLRRVRERPAG